MFFDLLEKRKINVNIRKAKALGTTLAICTFPGFLLSVLWAKPGYEFNVLAGITALIQLIATILLVALICKHIREIKLSFSKPAVLFLSVVLIGVSIKSLLQLVSSFPAVAQMAYELRPIVIAYLHLVLVGVISLFLLIWFLESDLLDKKQGGKIITLFLISFSGMEICLVLSPWWTATFGLNFLPSFAWNFIFALLLCLSCLLLLFKSRLQKN